MQSHLSAVLGALMSSPAPASVPRVASAALSLIDAGDYTAALNTLQTLAIRHAHGAHALTLFYVIDSALKQVQRQKEQEALTAALTRGMPLVWSAVAPLMDAERVQRLQRLVASWERQSFLPQLNLTVPPPAASPPPAVTPAPQPIVVPAAAPKPAPAVAPAPTPVPHPVLPAPHHKPHAHHPHVAPHHGGDEDGAEPFSGAGGSGVWNAQYVATVDSDLEFGDKILLPPSALGELTLRSVRFPILLQLRNPANNKRTYAGVREFSAPEGRCVVPRWVLQNVEGTETRRIHIRTVDLPQCTYARLRPLGSDFARVTDPKALLEALLRYFSALTLHHTLHLHGAHSYDFEVMELHPADAVCIIDTTMEVEFEGLENPPAEATVAAPAVAAAAKEQGWRQGSGDSWARDNPSVVVKTCGNCGSKVPQDKWALHEAVCYRQNFGCPKCGKKMKIADKAQHLAEAHAAVKCAACDATLEAFQMATHTAKECPARMVVCKFCTLSFQEHQGYCGSRTDVCELCGKRITLATAEAHKTECVALTDAK